MVQFLVKTGMPAYCPWALRVFSPRIKQLHYEVDHSPASSAEVKNVWSFISIGYPILRQTTLSSEVEGFD
jgi:hypothetical protein